VTHLPLPPRAGRGWWSGVLAQDGRVYCPPDGAASVLVLEPGREVSDLRISRLPRPEDDAVAAPSPDAVRGSRGIVWSRGALAADGRVFCGPFDGDACLAVDPAKQLASAVSWIGCSVAARAKWSDLVAAPDGRLYGAPFDGSSILVVDPVKEIAEIFGDFRIDGSGAKWTKGTVGLDGCLYCAPLAASSVLVIDPRNPTSPRFLGDLGSAQGKWNEGAVAANGKIYCSPDSACSVLVIDPERGTAQTMGVVAPGRRKWTKGVLAPDGLIYCAPLCSPSVLVIDPATDSVSTLGYLPRYFDGRFLWAAGTVGPDGRIYCAPLSAQGVLVIDPAAKQLSTVGDFGEEHFKWNQGVLAPDGRIYSSPAMDRYVGVLVIEAPGFRWSPDRSPFYPKVFLRALKLLLLIRHRAGRSGGSVWGAMPKDVLYERIFACFQRDWFS